VCIPQMNLLHFAIRLLQWFSLVHRHTCELSRVNHRVNPRSLVLPQRAAVAQPLDKCPLLYGTQRFITTFKRTRHWTLSWTTWIQSTPTYTISLSWSFSLRSF
jgi:hypothetical protein